MDVTFSTFLGQIVSNPVLAVTVILALGAIFVNGWTDAPNAIATCVTTRCMPARAAILMSAAFNFLGVLIMTHFNASVANTISHIVDFGGNSTMALACLCAALFSIVVYGATASRFGIPTSAKPQPYRRPDRCRHRPRRREQRQRPRVDEGHLRPGALHRPGLCYGLGPVQARLDSFRRRQQATCQCLL